MRFIQEANASSSLNHPNNITVFEIESGGNDPFISLEYVDGKTLDHLIGRHGMPLDEALGYAVQMDAALRAPHSADWPATRTIGTQYLRSNSNIRSS